MPKVIRDIQCEVLRNFLVKEIKKHLRRFAKNTEMERSCFSEFLQDWLWSVDDNSDIKRLYEAYEQIGGGEYLIKIDF